MSRHWEKSTLLMTILSLLPDFVSLIVVGAKKAEMETLKNISESKGVLERIICIPRVQPKEVAQYLKAADILINPIAISFPGSISSKLFEYMASGKPIVSFKGGANEEILSHGYNALLVENASEGDFARSIEKLINDADLASEISRNAKESSKRYTWQRRADIISEFIHKL